MRVGGARPPPLITFTLTSKVAVYAPAEWADTLTLFHLYQYMYSVVTAVARGTDLKHESELIKESGGGGVGMEDDRKGSGLFLYVYSFSMIVTLVLGHL